VATKALVLLHTPPLVRSVNAVDEPAQTVGIPTIVPADKAFTVTTVVVAMVPQLLVTVYDMVVVPDVRPLTTPEVPTVATPAFVLLHTPPLATSVNAIVDPAVRVAVPLIAPASGEGLIVTAKIAAAVPQMFVTV
jgi:hypothetical protein